MRLGTETKARLEQLLVEVLQTTNKRPKKGGKHKLSHTNNIARRNTDRK
jgi:hypothetical protein